MRGIQAIAIASTLAGCSGAGPGQRGGPTAAAPGRGEATACPMALPFTTATLAETERGGAITFTTSEEQVEELRRRVRALAEAHNALHPSRPTVEAVDHGARLALRADDPAQVEALRGALYGAAGYLRREGCEMPSEATL
jgi:hypothetical protein